MLLTSLLLSALPAAGPVAPQESSCSSNHARTASLSGEKDIVGTAVAAGSFKTLAAALEAGELIEALQGDGPFTVFAPTDAAFAALPEGTLEKLLLPENKGLLQSILTYHVVPDRLAAEQVVKVSQAETLNGQRIDVLVEEGGVLVDGAKVTQTDIACTNGIIHVIDTVLMPSDQDIIAMAVEDGRFKTLSAALEAAGLVTALQGDGPFTVFAPTDEAFAALPEGTVDSLLKPENKEQLVAVLKYHVVSGRVYADAASKGAQVKTLQGSKIETRQKGDVVFVQAAKVIAADIETRNGVIHIIDSVLLPE